uniref:Uncharacterized protein n=1 Tax=Sphaerodactylus townsendi TaxID=933632 RepID=A0ACB8EVB0_9SAUR
MNQTCAVVEVFWILPWIVEMTQTDGADVVVFLISLWVLGMIQTCDAWEVFWTSFWALEMIQIYVASEVSRVIQICLQISPFALGKTLNCSDCRVFLVSLYCQMEKSQTYFAVVKNGISSTLEKSGFYVSQVVKWTSSLVLRKVQMKFALEERQTALSDLGVILTCSASGLVIWTFRQGTSQTCFSAMETIHAFGGFWNGTNHASEEYEIGPIGEDCVSVTYPNAGVFLSVPATVGYETVPFFEEYVNEIGHAAEQSETFPALEGCGIWPFWVGCETEIYLCE